jgi:hypothetical protein
MGQSCSTRPIVVGWSRNVVLLKEPKDLLRVQKSPPLALNTSHMIPVHTPYLRFILILFRHIYQGLSSALFSPHHNFTYENILLKYPDFGT